MCLNKIEARVQNGNYTETTTELAKEALDYFLPGDYGLQGYLVPSDSEWNGTAFMMLSFFVYKLADMVGNMFNGNANNTRMDTNGLISNQRSFDSDVMLAVWEGGDLPAQLEYISRSMSTHMREPNSGGSDLISGTSYTTETYYTVRWPWLILPVAVIVLVAIFSLVLMFETRRTKTRLWKNSMLALLFHGLDDNARKQLVAEHTSGRLEKASQMDGFADTVKVQLALNENHGAEEFFVTSNMR